ncbi:ATP-dependent DNA helicase [Aquabacterium sp.]|uniref:ATP-dependent DNA helicase n=1 Tax=Aquabacterium sp. TaxID=1872578 RepID=UPI0025BA2350|nr:ATP-dependent DNA helicase [Aquabacterium sp.]
MTDVTTKLPLNQGQQDAADYFFSFLFAPEKEMGVTGPGGVGKTHLMGHMIDDIMPQYHATCKMMGIQPKYDSVAMLATTNQAAEVLSLSAGRPTSTAASFMGLKVAEDFETGETKLTKTRSWQVHERKIIFLDEASMVDTSLYQFLHEGTMNCKIVYVGDHCQMAPVKEKISPVYGGSIHHVELTQPMRTQIPELHALNWQLRTTVETGEFKPIQIVPGIIDWYSDDQMAAAVHQSFAQQTLDERILAYTNKRVVEYNDEIRWIRNLPPQFTVGELLICNHPLPVQRYQLKIGEEIEILSIKPDVHRLWIDNFGGADVEVEYQFAEVRNRLGMIFTDVRLPYDKPHFEGIVKWLASRKEWAKFFDLKKQILDLRQRDASTIYKAQGSSLDRVFIDVSNLSRSPNPSQAARMLYVGASRARKQIVFYGQLAERYGGLIL